MTTYLLALLGVVALAVGSWWLSRWAWEPRPEDNVVGPDVPKTLEELRRRAGVRRGERIP